MSKSKIAELELRRIAKRPTYTIGRLLEYGAYFCDTLEDPVRELKDLNNDGDFDDPGEGKIYGQTAIPAGRYEIVMTYSPRFKKIMPLLVGVPGFTGVRIHAGNSAEDTEGCILTGKNKIVGRLVDSRLWTELLYKTIQNYIDSGYKVFITISN